MDFLRELTIGQVSGLIAFGSALVAFTAPLLTGIILIRYYNKEVSAATWSVISRQLHSSAWPSILFSDSAAVKNVDVRVSVASYIGSLLVILVAVASVITPIGLQDQTKQTKEQNVNFLYIPDESSFGRNTQRRPDLPFSRTCTDLDATIPCPGVDFNGVIAESLSRNESFFNLPFNFTTTTKVPKNITEFFTSFSRNSTVAGPFDIQYRSWEIHDGIILRGNSTYLVGKKRTIDNLLSRESMILVEGLVVDLNNGGVGFRNHSIPDLRGTGKSWNEDILWIEPDIGCAKTNLSFEFTLVFRGELRNVDVIQSFLVDDGGFADLRPNESFRYNHFPPSNISSPDVRNRAMQSALIHNFYLSLAFNLTRANIIDDFENYKISNVSIGNKYRLPADKSGIESQVWPLGISNIRRQKMAERLGLPFARFNERERKISAYDTQFPIPENYTFLYSVALLNSVHDLCSGRYHDNFTSPSSVFNMEYNVDCWNFLGPPSRIDGGSSLEEVGSKWKASINICAAATRASVKNITFYNNGSSLNDLYVTSIRDKEYPDGAYPLWAFENFKHPPNEAARFSLLWGIVEESLAGTPGYNFTRSPDFYLPNSHLYTLDSLAATVAPTIVFAEMVFGLEEPGNSANIYKGGNNLALRTRWESLATSKDQSSELILKLIWTDIMANTVVGTRSRLSTTNPDGIVHEAIPGIVRVFGHRIGYDMRFSVPAIFLLTLWFLIIFWASWTCIAYKTILSRLKRLINDTSLGRAVLRVGVPAGRDAAEMSTRNWLKRIGDMKLGLRDSRFPPSTTDTETEQNLEYRQIRQEGAHEQTGQAREDEQASQVLENVQIVQWPENNKRIRRMTN